MGKGRRWSRVINVDIKMNEVGVEVSEEATEMGCVDLIRGNSYSFQPCFAKYCRKGKLRNNFFGVL